jgi:hypothetical protein
VGKRIVRICGSFPMFKRLRNHRLCIPPAPKLQEYRREHPMYWQTNTPAGDGSFGEWQSLNKPPGSHELKGFDIRVL